MKASWPEERKEIAVWLSGYLGMVKKWVDRILDNEDHEVNKNKILKTLDEWIKYLKEERHKIMMLKDIPVDSAIGPNDPGDEYEHTKDNGVVIVRPAEQQRLDGMDEG
jgi:hypothetical protein